MYYTMFSCIYMLIQILSRSLSLSDSHSLSHTHIYTHTSLSHTQCVLHGSWVHEQQIAPVFWHIYPRQEHKARISQQHLKICLKYAFFPARSVNIRGSLQLSALYAPSVYMYIHSLAPSLPLSLSHTHIHTHMHTQYVFYGTGVHQG